MPERSSRTYSTEKAESRVGKALQPTRGERMSGVAKVISSHFSPPTRKTLGSLLGGSSTAPPAGMGARARESKLISALDPFSIDRSAHNHSS